MTVKANQSYISSEDGERYVVLCVRKPSGGQRDKARWVRYHGDARQVHYYHSSEEGRTHVHTKLADEFWFEDNFKLV